jgi:hypothetical protein
MALQQAARGEKVEGPLAHLVETAQQVSVLSEPPPPPPNQLAPGRQRFLTEAARLRTAKAPADTRRAWLPRKFKLASALVALVLVFGLVLGAGQAAADSLPGEFLYDLKLAGEGFRLALTTSPAARADLNVALVEERLDEIAELVDRGQAPAPPTMDRATRQLETALDAATGAGENAAPWAFNRLKAVIQIHRRTTKCVVDTVPETEDLSVERFERAMERARHELNEGEGEPDGEQERMRHGEAPDPTAVPDPADRPGPGPQPTDRPGEPHPTEPPGRGPQPTEKPGEPQATDHPGLGPGPQPTEKPGEPQATDHPSLGPGPQPTEKPGEPNPPDEPGKGPGEDASPTGEPGGKRRRLTATPTPTPTATEQSPGEPGHPGHEGDGAPGKTAGP